MKEIILLFSLTFLAIGIKANANTESSCPGLEKIEGSLIGLKNKYPSQVFLKKGRSAHGRNLYFITLSSGQTYKKIRPAVYISGATHGNEYMNIVDRLGSHWLNKKSKEDGANRFLNNGGLIFLVPVLNPDGLCRPSMNGNASNKRFNGNFADLNRDFPLKRINFKGKSQPETRFVLKTLEKELKTHHARMVMTWDYHCCLPIGKLLYPWGYRTANNMPPKQNLAADKLESHLKIARIVKRIHDYDSGTPWQTEYAPGKILGGVQGASDDYFFETYFLNAPFPGRSFTFEGQKKEKDFIFKHWRMWDKIFRLISQEQKVYLRLSVKKPQQKIKPFRKAAIPERSNQFR